MTHSGSAFRLDFRPRSAAAASCIALVLGLFACGGSDPTEITDPLPSATDASVSTSLPEAGDASTSDASASANDSGGQADGSSGDAGKDAGKDLRIDPIEVGRAWTYDVTVLGFYPACATGTFVSTALGSAPKDGKTAITVQSLCKNAGTFDYAVEGDRVFAYVAGWRLSLDAPVAEGHTWSDGLRTYKWESKGSVTVPAGTYGDCWSATVVASYSSYTVFCRGIGPVKWHYEDGLGNGYEANLKKVNF
jgi:hypothetical protein